MTATLLLAGCPSHESHEAPKSKAEPTRKLEIRRALARVRAHEQELRKSTRFEARVPASRALGPDPYRLCVAGDAFLGVLRGSSEVVLFGRDLQELARAKAPARPVDCATTTNGDVAVLGQGASELRIYRVDGGQLSVVATQALDGVISPRALAAHEKTLFVADGATGVVVSYEIATKATPLRRLNAREICHGPFALTVAGEHLVTACQLDHALVVRPIAGDGSLGPESARVVHDGPFWGVSALESEGALFIAASGVEDHPLVRFEGAFGYVDSFVYLYRVEGRGRRTTRLQALNTSEHGALVAKGLSLARAGHGAFSLWTTAYGSDTALHFHFRDPEQAPLVTKRTFLPGISAVVESRGSLFATTPLLDSWARLDDRTFASQSVASALPERPLSVRLGEALVFTSLIAPQATSDGQKSRFTCETCHFEGGIDGRIHDTGRGNVRVTTRPLFGLLANAPHFSRALDPDLTSVSHNEFRVAGLANPHDPWFTLKTADFPWLLRITGESELAPEPLRRAFLDFLAEFEPDDNERARGRSAYGDAERQGAALFQKRCASCHAARLVSDDANSEVAFERWESLIFSEASPILWARGDYSQCGVTPYVHPRGTRIPALRRVSRKYPYFTNGSASSLAEVVAGARFRGDGEFFHGNAPDGTERFSGAEAGAVVAFLSLL